MPAMRLEVEAASVLTPTRRTPSLDRLCSKADRAISLCQHLYFYFLFSIRFCSPVVLGAEVAARRSWDPGCADCHEQRRPEPPSGFGLAVRGCRDAVTKAKKAGLVSYELITLFVVAVNFTTVNWLATVSDHLPKGTPRNYEGISRKYLGAGASHVISLVFIFGSLALGMSYMLFTAQSLAPILAGWMSPSHELPSESEVSHLSRILLWVLGLGVVLPLSLLRDISKLKFTSTLAIFALAYAAGFIVFSNLEALAAQPRAGEGFQLVNVHSDFFLSLAMTTSNFSCHISAIPIYESLASRNASTMKRVVALALGTSALFYQVVGLTSYCRFGRLEAGQGNILEVVAERISLLETPLRFALEPQMSE